jgi:hypothetical protein
MQSLIERWRSFSYALIPLVPTAVTTFIVLTIAAGPVFAASAPPAPEAPAALKAHSTDGPTDRRAGGGPTRVLGGLTSAGWPATLALSGGGRTIKTAVVGVDLRCSDGEEFALADPWLLVPVKSNGAFKARFDDSITDQGATVDISDSLSGKFNRERTKVSAKLSLQMTVHAPDGSVLSCDSGNVSLRARD